MFFFSIVRITKQPMIEENRDLEDGNSTHQEMPRAGHVAVGRMLAQHAQTPRSHPLPPEHIKWNGDAFL